MYAIFTSISGQTPYFLRNWLKTFVQMHRKYFERCGQFYLTTKGLSFDTWLDTIDEGRKRDVLTLYGLSLLNDVHSFVHLHAGQSWTTLKVAPPSHEEAIKKCRIHVLYLGRGLYVKLVERMTPLQLIKNPDPGITSLVIGELSELEKKNV